MQCIPYGPNAILLKFADAPGDAAFTRSRALVAALERNPPPGLVDYVPAFTTLLLEFDSGLPPDLKTWIAQLQVDAALDLPAPPIREIPVTYDGPDLARVADANALTTAEVIALHAEPVYKVYLLGFSPGFPYLGDLNPRLHTPRLTVPRSRVQAGSVAIGGSHTGIYSIDSPGGWNIIGSTQAKLFDPSQPSAMFLLAPGDRVRFVPA